MEQIIFLTCACPCRLYHRRWMRSGWCGRSHVIGFHWWCLGGRFCRAHCLCCVCQFRREYDHYA